MLAQSPRPMRGGGRRANICSMTSQGSLHGQFQRALARGNVLPALALARELAPLPLGEALVLLNLVAAEEPGRFPPAAAHWYRRFVAETPRLSLAEASLALALLRGIGDRSDEAMPALVALCRRHRVPGTPRS